MDPPYNKSVMSKMGSIPKSQKKTFSPITAT